MSYIITDKETLQHIANVCRVFNDSKYEDVILKIQETCESQFDNEFSFVVVKLEFTDPITTNIAFAIPKEYIKKAKDYDPTAWNPYPFVVPPKNGWYRTMDGDYYSALYWENGIWVSVDGEEYASEDFTSLIFRPWED